MILLRKNRRFVMTVINQIKVTTNKHQPKYCRIYKKDLQIDQVAAEHFIKAKKIGTEMIMRVVMLQVAQLVFL